jgi:hypothetical protein
MKFKKINRGRKSPDRQGLKRDGVHPFSGNLFLHQLHSYSDTSKIFDLASKLKITLFVFYFKAKRVRFYY